MKVIWPVFAAVVVIIAVFLAITFRGTLSAGVSADPAVGYCQANEEILPRERRAIEAAALNYMDVFERLPVEARALMSRAGRNATRDRQGLEAAATEYNGVETSTARAMTGAYLLRFTGGSRTGAAVPCGLEGGRAAFASRGATWKTAIVMLTEGLPGGSERTITLWMEHERGAWAVRAFHFVPSQIAGKDAEQLWAAAREQRSARHAFNANMLYAAARTTMTRGSFLQLPIAQDFQADIRTFRAPPELQGEAPYAWRLGGKTFNVTHFQYSGLGDGTVALIVDHASGPWETSADAEVLNHALIDSFDAAYPEWRDIFDAVVARAAKPNTNETWGTVYLKDGGYSAGTAE